MKLSWYIFVLSLILIFNIKAQTFDASLASSLQEKLDSIRISNNLKGISVSVIYPGMGSWKGVSGVSHDGTPISSDLLFGIGSNTKLFTGVLILKLAENKIIHLDDSIYRFLPNFNNVNPNITIRQLLNHTSGLADVNNVIGYSDSILKNPNRIFKPTEVMTWVGKPLFSPGKGWNYCNTNYILAGMIAESATGQSFAKLLRDSILSPLKLNSTFLDVFENISNLIAHPWQGGVDKSLIPRKSINSVAWAAGAMYATSYDMTNWYYALMNGKVLNKDSFLELTKFVGTGNYGIGLYSTNILDRTVWQHGGTIWGGYNSSMVYDIETGIIISVLINQLPAQAFQVSTQLLSVLVKKNTLSFNENTIKENMISVYPNPTDGLVYFNNPNQTKLKLKVFDLQGQLMCETNESVLDLTNYSPGIYLVENHTTSGINNYRLIKK